MIAALALIAVQAAAATGTPENSLADMAPATAEALRAGTRACVGATVDPAGQDFRLAGWVDATPAQKRGIKSDGRIVQRDNVLVIVKSGIEGGCVVMANLPTSFNRAAFLADLGRDIGRVIVADPKNPVTDLGKGEVLVTTLTGAPHPTAVLVVGNTHSKAVRNKGKQ